MLVGVQCSRPMSSHLEVLGSDSGLATVCQFVPGCETNFLTIRSVQGTEVNQVARVDTVNYFLHMLTLLTKYQIY